jgi:hypothetical protein
MSIEKSTDLTHYQNDDGTYTIPSDKVERWKRQQNTTYEGLSEQEKESDREQADKVLAILNQVVKTI